MKKLCLIIAYLFLFTQTASAMPLLVGQKVVYRGTVTGLRISAVDGTAFIDNAGATIPTYADGNHQIEIYDSANRMLRGVLKAAGSAETLGTDILAGWNFTSGWELISAGSIVDADSYISGTNAYHGIRTTSTVLDTRVGQLCTATWAGTTASSIVVIRRQNANGETFASGFGTGYATVASGGKIALLNSQAATQTDVSSLSFKQVLTPSTSGATIVTAKGGTTYNFSYKNASFTYNASSYYVIIRAIR